MRGQMFGNLLNTIATQGGRVAKAAAPVVRSVAVPAAVTGGVLGLGALGKAGVDAVRGEKLAQGETLTSGSPGMASDADAINLLRQTSNITVDQARQLLPVIQQLRNAELERGMQATAQVGQIQGDLARQKYGYQLAGGAQTTGARMLEGLMGNANPYAQTGLGGVNLSL